ncbi:protein TolQ [Zavarzinia compransoris]
MSVWHLVGDASLLVKLVMALLVLASLASWFLILQRSLLLAGQERADRAFLRRFRECDDLAALPDPSGAGLAHLFRAGFGEYRHLAGRGVASPEAVTEGVERRLLVAIAEEEERLGRGLPFLATVGSVSPYIGLFGTVWGIMNSFIGLSQVQQATLSTVAPGIAEALIATAIGLFAAIPAVVAYNRFSARVSVLSTRFYAFGNELQARLNRRLRAGDARQAA